MPATRRDLTMIFEDGILPLLATYRHKIETLETKLAEMGAQLEDARTELHYLTWARQEALKA